MNSEIRKAKPYERCTVIIAYLVAFHIVISEMIVNRAYQYALQVRVINPKATNKYKETI